MQAFAPEAEMRDGFYLTKKPTYFSVGVTPPTVTRGTTVGTAETDGE